MSSGLTSEREGAVAVARLARPDTLNSLVPALLGALSDALQAADRDPGVRCLVVMGDERAFATGEDPATYLDRSTGDGLDDAAWRPWQEIARLRKPLVAAVAGFALDAGLELVLLADVVIAAESACFGMSQTRFGLIPGGGATQRLPRRVGRALAGDMLLSGRTLGAMEARGCGLVSRVVPIETLESQAVALAQELARANPLALAAAKDALRQAEELPLTAGLAYERQVRARLLASDDFKEGIRAFMEQRPPLFVGR
ncbi:MAG: enoyl-CoA hydratase/isomerase family protein [Phycisphaerales bacterium]|nr:enoyl-CoA hydratase/isomerase family protein [Phycisphaerales bacterium]